MKECKCGRIPPCYTDGYGVWHHLDDTHDKVYELNRQMCDLGKTMNDPMKPLSEDAIQKIAKALEITRKPKGIIMEEKKTKKMTKAEAFEYFKGKRVVCYNFDCVAIQRKFFEAGIKWRGGSTNATADHGGFLFVDLNGCITHCNSRAWFDAHEYEEISAYDILSIEIVEETRSEDEVVEIVELGKKIMCLLPKLSGHRHVVITETDVLLYDEGISLYHSDPF